MGHLLIHAFLYARLHTMNIYRVPYRMPDAVLDLEMHAEEHRHTKA